MKLKKLLAMVISVAMILGTIAIPVFAEEADVWNGTTSNAWLEDGNPEGTAGDKFYLESAAELAGFAEYVNTYSSTNNIFVGDTVYLCVDVDLNNIEWTPIGAYSNISDKKHFHGSFDGQNHTISNLKISEEAGQIYGGLFGRFKTTSFSQTFSNLTLHNVDITTVASSDGKEGAGALMGYGYDEIIDNVHVTGNISISGASCVGGLAGQSRANISNSSVEASGTVSGDYRVGGLVGWFISASANGYNAEINDCFVKGDETEGFTVKGATTNVGGLVGRVNNNDGTVVIDDVAVYNASVSSDNNSVAYVVPDFTATNTTVANVTATVAGEEATPSDNENVSFAVAEVGGEYFTDIRAAIQAMTAENNTLNILDTIIVDYKWDCRPVSKGGTGATFTFPVVINGNNNTIKFTNEISDGFNHLAVFRPEAEATFTNLTVDMSEAISVFQNKFSAISTKTGDLTVENCTFIGSETYKNARAIIFGEGGNSETLANTDVSVTDCDFINCKYGVTDNLNGSDVASVTIIDSDFTNASINVSASEEVTITDNVVDGGFVKVTSYTQSPEQNLTVTVTGNTLDEDFAADNQIQAGTIIDAQDGFTTPVATVNGKKYMTLKSAVANADDNDVVYLVPGTYEDELVINKSITITGDPNYSTGISLASVSQSEKPVIKISDVTNGGVEYHAPNVTFDNLVFEVAEDATGSGWNVSALGYYYEIVANREGLTVTNCDFINNSDISLGAIAANIGKYTITNNTFTNFTTGVWSYVDHGAADEIVVSDNTFENVADLVNIYHGAAADGTANVTIANNVATDGSTTQITVIDFGQQKDTPATAYDNVVITDNDAEVVLGNYAEDSFDDTIEGNEAVVYTYASEDILKALEAAGIPDGDVYVQYNSANEVLYKVVDGAVYAAADALEVEFELASEAEGEKVYNINLKANAQGIINRLNSADLTFLFTQVEGNNEYEIIASNSEVAINPVDNSKVRYEFHYNGKDNVLTDTDTVITIGQVKFTGYGKFSFAVDANATTNAAHSTTMQDNIVDTFVPGGILADGTVVGDFDITDDTIKDIVIAVPDRNLTITVDFPNAVKDQAIAYQDMKVVISGGDLAKDITIDLGNDAVETALDIFGKEDAKFAAAMDNNGSYVINVTDALTLNNAYTVTVSGAGYRTARYTVTMTDDKQLNFWNNVMDEAQVVEVGKDSSIAKVTFLAGDIVKDNNINIYDLSAVVSYFGSVSTTENGYAKYDLNRDGVIDSKDVAYVLVSWGE